jgi:hypothetical protein
MIQEVQEIIGRITGASARWLTPAYNRAASARLARELAEPKPANEAGPPTVDHTIGLDLGQSQDFSALCVVERTKQPAAEATYAVRHLQRWALGTAYTQIAADVADLATHSPLGCPRLAVDQTGVGRPCVEMVRAAIRDKAGDGPRPHLVPILITTGNAVTSADGGWHVAKVQLVSTLQVLLSSGRLRIAADLPDAPALVKELKAFKAKVTAANNLTFEAWRERDHDDLVLAVALAVWLAENTGRGRFEIL